MYQIPYVIEDTGRGERAMDIFSRLLKDRIIFLGTEINDQIANTIIAQFLFLKAEDPKKEVSFYINSPGGYNTSGFAIYDTMCFMGFDMNTYCIGQAVGVAALLLSAGTKGKRFSLPNSRIMLHQPIGAVTGQSVDINLQAKEVIQMKKKYASIISLHTGQSIEKIIEDSERDFYLSAEGALEYHLIDKIASHPVALPQQKP